MKDIEKVIAEAALEHAADPSINGGLGFRSSEYYSFKDGAHFILEFTKNKNTDGSEELPLDELCYQAGFKRGLELAAKIAFQKIRCDDRTDRLQIANEVADHIRAAVEGEKK